MTVKKQLKIYERSGMCEMAKKIFNINGNCRPRLHYMVNLEQRLAETKKMVDRGDYFTINRARQYGKTTMLKALERYLQNDYVIISLDFQKLSRKDFETEGFFVKALSREILKKASLKGKIPDEIAVRFQAFAGKKEERLCLAGLFDCFSSWCGSSIKPIVLMIDEADSAANNQVFLDFLAQLRGAYMDRDEIEAFQSVILAGVYDIRTLKRKLADNDEHRLNSPWNIAADFLVDMNFSAEDIAGMLYEYQQDSGTNMDIDAVAGLIYDYTSGYPFLVSKICKLLDEQIAGSENYKDRALAWTREGVMEAVRILLMEQNTLFESLINKLEDYPELKELLRDLLFQGKDIVYVVGIRSIEIALMFGFVKRRNGTIVLANRIFELLLYNFFLSSPEMQKNSIYDAALKDRNQFIRDGCLDMRLVLEKFVLHFDQLYGDRNQAFLEEDGRRFFLLYLKPIINGTGNYYIESQTRNMERTDVIVDYCGEQFVVELKIWRGNAYNERGEEQLSAYLDYYHLKKGYMLSFNFNKSKRIGVKEIQIRDKILVEAVV